MLLDRVEWNDRWRCLTDYDRLCKSVNLWNSHAGLAPEASNIPNEIQVLNWGLIWSFPLFIRRTDYWNYYWNQICKNKLAKIIHSWEERLTCFDCKVCFGSKFTSSAEGRRFNWLIYDSMTSLFACRRFSKFRGLSASVSFLPSPPFIAL